MLKSLPLFVILAAMAGAQDFEVASIRRCTDQGGQGPAIETTPGRLTANCVSVSYLIETSFAVAAASRGTPTVRVTLENTPAWIKSEEYQITAKAEDPNASATTLSGAMLWKLLETRFQMKTYQVVEDIPIYAVTLGKDDSKLRAHEEHSCSPCAGFRPTYNGNRITFMAEGVSLDWLRFLGPMALRRPVENRTGITGSYTFRLEYEMERAEGAPPSTEPLGPSIFDVLEKELGLRLVESKGPAVRIVVDSIERPSEN